MSEVPKPTHRALQGRKTLAQGRRGVHQGCLGWLKRDVGRTHRSHALEDVCIREQIGDWNRLVDTTMHFSVR